MAEVGMATGEPRKPAWTTVIKYQGLGGLNNRHLFLSLKAEKTNIGTSRGRSCLVRVLFLDYRCLSPYVPHMVERESKLYGFLLLRALIPS